MSATAYVFYADGFAKIGHTSDMDGRLLQLLWGVRPPYIPAGVGRGELIARRDFATVEEARATEIACQDDLDEFVFRRNRRGGRCEWFRVSSGIALAAFQTACDDPYVSIALPERAIERLRRLKTRYGLPSLHAALIKAVSDGAAKDNR